MIPKNLARIIATITASTVMINPILFALSVYEEADYTSRNADSCQQ